jgi:hypothetical protein
MGRGVGLRGRGGSMLLIDVRFAMKEEEEK